MGVGRGDGQEVLVPAHREPLLAGLESVYGLLMGLLQGGHRLKELGILLLQPLAGKEEGENGRKGVIGRNTRVCVTPLCVCMCACVCVFPSLTKLNVRWRMYMY